MDIGDIVFLKSGSPKLTVTNVSERSADVSWISSHGVERHTFPQACLTSENPFVMPRPEPRDVV